MKIKQINYEVTDRLFFYMLQDGIEYGEDCEDTGLYFMDVFTWDRRSQLNVLGSIPEADAQTEWDHLCDDVNWHGNHKYAVHFIGGVRIDPEHPDWNWADVVTYDGPSFTFEKFVESQNVQA